MLAEIKGKEKESYHEILQEYLWDRSIKMADLNFDGICTYPLTGNQNAGETTKIRLVFDGSAHLREKPSINAALETGSNLNPEVSCSNSDKIKSHRRQTSRRRSCRSPSVKSTSS